MVYNLLGRLSDIKKLYILNLELYYFVVGCKKCVRRVDINDAWKIRRVYLTPSKLAPPVTDDNRRTVY